MCWCALPLFLSLSSHGEGKRGGHKPQGSERRGSRGRPWRPPPSPDHTHVRIQSTGHRAQGMGQAAGGLPLGPRTARASLNPQTPAPGRGPGRKEAVPEVGQLGQVTLALLCPKRGPHVPQAPAGHSLQGGWLATEIRDLLPSWAPSAVRDPVSPPLPPSAGRSCLGWGLGTSRRRPRAYFRPGLGGVPVPSLPRSWGASSRFGETPRGWGSPAIGGWGKPRTRGKKAFPDPRP